jgi:hypothetical protein
MAKAGAPPFGPRRIPPVDPKIAFRSAGTGSWSEDRWHNEALGFELQPPRPFRKVTNPMAAFMAVAPGLTVVGTFVDEQGTAKARDEFFNAFVRAALSSAFHEAPPALSLSTRHRWSELPPGALVGYELEEHYPLRGRKQPLGIRCRVIPLCDSNAAFYMAAFYVTDEAARTAGAWFDGLATTSQKPPVCSEP